MKVRSTKILLSTMILLLLSNATVLAAEGESDPYVDGKLSMIRCLEKGNYDFIAFLQTAIWNDNLKEGFVEPWKDVLARNQCQTLDISQLIKKQDSIRKAIRDAFLTCNTQKLPHLKLQYNKITAEIYYVRHIVDGGMVLGLPYDLNTRAFGAATIKDRNELYNEMYGKYAKASFIPQEVFDLFFLELEDKYEDRKKTYQDCDSGSWQLVQEKWNEFIESGAGVGDALESAGKRIKGQAKSLAKEFNEMETVELLKGNKSFDEYVGSFFQVNLNNLGLKEGIAEIGESISKNLPSTGGIDQGYITAAITGSNQTFELNKVKADLKSEFTTLYGNASDETLELFLNTLDGRKVKELGLIEVLEESYKPLNVLLDKTKIMVDRQCSG